jgi:hypothetical protein
LLSRNGKEMFSAEGADTVMGGLSRRTGSMSHVCDGWHSQSTFRLKRNFRSQSHDFLVKGIGRTSILVTFIQTGEP